MVDYPASGSDELPSIESVLVNDDATDGDESFEADLGDGVISPSRVVFR